MTAAPGRLFTVSEQPDRLYPGDGIVVEWYASRCIHSGNCARALLRVFNPRRRPWIDATAAPADQVVAAVENCPSGALQYRRSARDEPVKEEEEKS